MTNRYTGQQLDEDTGLYFYGSRYYDPELARFIQPDSIVPDYNTSQVLNRYTYCNNNPLIFVDPSGNIFGIIAAIASFVAANASVILASAVINAGFAAAQGGNMWKAAAAGALAGGFGAVGGILGAAAGGALGALVTGGDPGMAAATAAIAAGVSIACDFTPISDWANALPDIQIFNIHLRKLAATSGVRELSGGITAEIYGGEFEEGALQSALSASSGYAISANIGIFMEATVELANATLDLTVETLCYAINIAGAIAAPPFVFAGAILGDIIYGPLDQLVLDGLKMGIGDDINVKAFRLHDLLGVSYVPSGNEIHTSLNALKRLRKGELMEHFKHEIGHVIKARESGVLYYLTDVLFTFPATILDKINIGNRNTPFHIFENQATKLGKYPIEKKNK